MNGSRLEFWGKKVYCPFIIRVKIKRMGKDVFTQCHEHGKFLGHFSKTGKKQPLT